MINYSDFSHMTLLYTIRYFRPFISRLIDLIESLVISLNTDLSGIASRDEDEIHRRQRETYWPPERGQKERIRTGRGVIGGQRVLGRQCRIEHHRKNGRTSCGQQTHDEKIRGKESALFAIV